MPLNARPGIAAQLQHCVVLACQCHVLDAMVSNQSRSLPHLSR